MINTIINMNLYNKRCSIDGNSYEQKLVRMMTYNIKYIRLISSRR